MVYRAIKKYTINKLISKLKNNIENIFKQTG